MFSDDQRAGTIHVLGNKEIITPNIDKLANEGLSFVNASIMGSMSGAVCAPSRAMLMTGRSLFNIEPSGSVIDSSYITLPKTLEKAGYNTFHIGKWHNGQESFQRSFSGGSRIFFGGMHSHYNVPTYEYNVKGDYSIDNRNELSKVHSSELYADAAIKFIDNYSSEEPFYLNVSFQAPHDPREMPKKYMEMYNIEDLSLPPNFLPMHPFPNGELNIRDEWLAGYPRTPQEIRANIASYYAMITHLDEQIGRVLKSLKEKGLIENTIIIFAGDNGLAVGQHGLMGKQNLYEHSINVPLIFKGPDIPTGIKTNSSSYLFDIYPTLCDLVGISIPSTVNGKSLKPVINGKIKQRRKAQLFAYKNFQRSVRKDNWKLIKYNVKGTITTQLFNLKEDPFETNNISENKAYKEQLNDMTALMQELMIEYNDSVDLEKPGWGVSVLPAWVDQIDPKRVSYLKELAKKERAMRGFN
ncbi:MAG: sulfatase-like hydrolase/transferase [Flavobacteriaceae bacterium]|nr:sulfatase-like hydrolase/transferase [Flavobacteriaceae bacterium]